MLKISSGKVFRAVKAVLYGSEGIGKSTFASCFPEPLFIDTENGTSHMDVRRIDRPQSWNELMNIVKEVAATPEVCKTLILDTADWAEQLCVNHVCTEYKKSSIEAFGYGKGYTYLAEEFNRLLAAFDAVIASGKHVVITAHAKMRKFEQPDEMGAYDRWEMKLSKQVAPLIKEWCDLLLFLNYKTFVVASDNDTKKVQGGKRVMYTSHHPCWDAKNRHGLPPEIDMSYQAIAHIFEQSGSPSPMAQQPAAKQPAQESPLDTLRALMAKDGITEKQLRQVVAASQNFPADLPVNEYPNEFITNWCLKYWPNIYRAAKQSGQAQQS